MVQEGTKVSDEAVNEVPALVEEPPKEVVAENPPAAPPASIPVSTALAVAPLATPTSGTPTAALTGPGPALLKEDEYLHRSPLGHEEVTLVEVHEALVAANDVFNRVKSEKIAEQALCSIRNDQAQYEGLAKEIVGKAIKQKERERANRASAAASRAKVLRYQTELESRLNRMEAERNAYRKEAEDLQSRASRRVLGEEGKQLAKLQDWIRKMEAANPQFVRSIIAQGEMDKLLGEDGEEKLDLTIMTDVKEEEGSAKRRRV